MPETRYFFGREGEQVEITLEELALVLKTELEEAGIAEEVVVRDLNLVANMINHVKNGTIKSAGLIRGRVVRATMGDDLRRQE